MLRSRTVLFIWYHMVPKDKMASFIPVQLNAKFFKGQTLKSCLWSCSLGLRVGVVEGFRSQGNAFASDAAATAPAMYSLKTTLLSWACKDGSFDMSERMILGHLLDKPSAAALCYGRADFAGPLRQVHGKALRFNVP